MTKKEVEEEVKNFQSAEIEMAKRIAQGAKEVLPFITVMARTKNSLNIFKMGIPVRHMSSDSGKHMAHEYLCDVLWYMKLGGAQVVCTSMVSETWIRKLETKDVPENWRSLPKKEGVTIFFSTAEDYRNYTFEVSRVSDETGSEVMEVDETGVTDITLPISKLDTRVSNFGIYSKFLSKIE